jgi:tRNA threonylcarbamoyladenosine biosynthesis protein TsaB
MTCILAVETAFETCSAALTIDGNTREIYYHRPREHGELLLAAIEQLLAEGSIQPSGIDIIAFSRGPGSFTSLRLGIGVVQGLAWSSDCGVVPVSSLMATAQVAMDEAGTDFPESWAGACPPRITVAMDARMNEVFACSYRPGAGGLVVPEQGAAGTENVCTPVQASAQFEMDFDTSIAAGNGKDQETYLAVGNGFTRYPALEQWFGGVENASPDREFTAVWPRASAVSKLAIEWMKTSEPLEARAAQPVYLRDNVANRPVNRDPANS